ncbi:MAG: LysE family transporter [Chloroflexota bacterium]
MTPLWEGIIAGYGIAIPVGAIAILIVDVGLRRGFWLALSAGAGAASADFLYASLAAIAGEVLADWLTPLAAGLRLLSAGVLLALGGLGLWRARRPSNTPKVADRGYGRTFSQFLGLTLLNPLTVAYFASLILGRSAGALVTIEQRILFVVGAGLASLSWQSLLAGLGALAHHRLSPRFQIITSVFGNLVIIILGLRMLF